MCGAKDDLRGHFTKHRVFQSGPKRERSPQMEEQPAEERTKFRVVVNHEGQYSIWPVEREVPLGWDDTGTLGAKGECLAHIEEVWTDMTPLSLRHKGDSDERAR
jgi:MbtH protein